MRLQALLQNTQGKVMCDRDARTDLVSVALGVANNQLNVFCMELPVEVSTKNASTGEAITSA